jgi:hypothetical protein
VAGQARSAGAAAATVLMAALIVLTACGGPRHARPEPPQAISRTTSTTPPVRRQTGALPAPAHTVVVVMENHSYSEIIGNPAAPFVNRLARDGALFTHSSAITHPSEPNYLALFSGSTHGVTDDSCPVRFVAPNLASALLRAGRTFAGFAEGLPAAGSPVCYAGEYARKHVPWADFGNVPPSVSKPFASFPGSDLARLPTVSFVVPNLCNDMHDCSVATGDRWLRAHLGGYLAWAASHHSLLILTWDENDGSAGNRITTIFIGPMVRPGRYAQPITHYTVLATIEAAYGLARTGQARLVRPITSIWRPATRE